ncbi:IclR family transcriptional regulator [Geobacter hydrogenophilus]|uniref:IclR family transcriptional regulator n=1 Tax=Geobacter hydrogenophilus TaxID=40983 RepID=A0A9W6G0X5_9BACT|nr:IclR family transcriptional regulator [Geobacter hydrogenophilus]MBT0894304.1 IclR family transcriptional regulator [Geobacter hydrogenophilus]GLI38409.1 IclR family transcriptional regulator [Geobacter hydrogenophilus]
MQKKDKSDYMILAVSHALDLLEQFHGEGVSELGVTELAKRLRLHKNNVFRLLATLEAREYVEQNRVTGNYRLGLKTLEIRQTMIRQMALLPYAKPVLEELVRECDETAYVSILKENLSIYLYGVESRATVRVVSRLGSRLPAYCTAAGKVMLASLSEPKLERYLARKELVPFTPNTITDATRLREHLKEIAAAGYAIDNEELEIGVRGVAAPIRDYRTETVGAVIISGPTMRFSDERVATELVPLAQKAAETISVKLGYSGAATE